MFTLEEERRSQAGSLLTCGPGTYKIPGFADIPVEMNVTLLKGASNPKAVYSSKVSYEMSEWFLYNDCPPKTWILTGRQIVYLSTVYTIA